MGCCCSVPARNIQSRTTRTNAPVRKNPRVPARAGGQAARNEEPKALKWVEASMGNIPKFAVKGGMDSGKNLYVIRAEHIGGMIPGKLHPTHNQVYIPYGGKEYAKTKYEVLIAPPGCLRWEKTEGRNIPTNAIVGGYDPNSAESYYIGRAEIDGTITNGKVSKMYGLCYVPYDMLMAKNTALHITKYL